MRPLFPKCENRTAGGIFSFAAEEKSVDAASVQKLVLGLSALTHFCRV